MYCVSNYMFMTKPISTDYQYVARYCIQYANSKTRRDRIIKPIAEIHLQLSRHKKNSKPQANGTLLWYWLITLHFFLISSGFSLCVETTSHSDIKTDLIQVACRFRDTMLLNTPHGTYPLHLRWRYRHFYERDLAECQITVTKWFVDVGGSMYTCQQLHRVRSTLALRL